MLTLLQIFHRDQDQRLIYSASRLPPCNYYGPIIFVGNTIELGRIEKNDENDWHFLEDFIKIEKNWENCYEGGGITGRNGRKNGNNHNNLKKFVRIEKIGKY